MAVWLAPAKLNLFLHITGQREDGYHLLQSVFQFVDLYDEMEFALTNDGSIHQASEIDLVSEDQNLAVIAARKLKAHADCKYGASIAIKKKIPMGAGLGGGSSNAATTLIALNQLWDLHLSRDELAEIGVEIGADVPVFVKGDNAWAQGIGDKLTPIELETCHFLIIVPPVHVSTAEIFSNPKLTRTANPIKIQDFREGTVINHLQAVTCESYPQVKTALKWLENYGKAKMSGSGAAVFARVDHPELAQQAIKACPSDWQAIYVTGLTRHPHR